MVSDYLAFNRAYRAHLDARRGVDLHREYELGELASDVDRRYALWDLVRDSSVSYYYVHIRRRALRDLRERLGPADYYSGHLPPWVPTHAFRSAE